MIGYASITERQASCLQFRYWIESGNLALGALKRPCSGHAWPTRQGGRGARVERVTAKLTAARLGGAGYLARPRLGRWETRAAVVRPTAEGSAIDGGKSFRQQCQPRAKSSKTWAYGGISCPITTVSKPRLQLLGCLAVAVLGQVLWLQAWPVRQHKGVGSHHLDSFPSPTPSLELVWTPASVSPLGPVHLSIPLCWT